jgi:hypothetical protein
VRSLVVAGTVVAALAAAGAVVAFGEDDDGHVAHAKRRASAAAAPVVPPAVTVVPSTAPHAGSGSTRSACRPVIDATILGVAARIYAEAAGGANVVSAARRLEGSAALARAVRAGDASLALASVRPLLRGQIHRIVITRGSRVLVRLGSEAALAPVDGVVTDPAGRPVGRYAFAVGNESPIVGIIQALTGAEVRVLAAGAGAPVGAIGSFPITLFPSGARRLWLIGGAPVACAGGRDQAADATIAAVATRLYRIEATGPTTQRVLRHVARDPRLQSAVAHRDPVALRSAIVRFFRTHSLHVVRIRATTARGRLIGDVGGPFVLAPASTAVTDRRGHVIGHVTLSIQDDTGYMKLVQRFTGAGVVMRTPAGVVPGSAPVSGTPAFSFTAAAFPRGPLTVELFG